MGAAAIRLLIAGARMLLHLRHRWLAPFGFGIAMGLALLTPGTARALSESESSAAMDGEVVTPGPTTTEDATGATNGTNPVDAGAAADRSSKSLETSPEAARRFLNQDFDMSYSYVGGSKVSNKTNGVGGDVSEQSSSLGYGVKVPVSPGVLLTLGVDYNRLDFSLPAGSYLPQNLQKFSIHVGVDYKLSQQWSLFASTGPQISTIDGVDVYSNEISFQGAVGATYKPSDNLLVRFGLSVSPDDASGLPVMPVIGVRWKFAPDWTLNAGVPKTSIDWQVLPNLRFSPLTVGFEGGTFHTSNSYGDKVGAPELDGRTLNYMEVRVGAEASYSLTKDLAVELSTGAVVYRDFKFKDDDNLSPMVNPAPYVQVGMKYEF